MRVRIWGARGSVPCPGPANYRYGGNTACVSIETDSGQTVILDAGTGIRALGEKLANTERPAEAIVLISHFHWDHILGLPFFQPLYQADSHFLFFSFPQADTSFQEIMESTMKSPFFPVSMRGLSGRREFYEIGEQRFSVGDVHIQTCLLNHPQGCLGYRVECDGTSVVYATDHESDAGPADEKLAKLTRGADLLITDAQYTPAEYEIHRGWGHSSVDSAVRLAQRAKVRQLLLFHHDPAHSDAEIDQMAAYACRHLPGAEAAAEGMEIELSPSSVAVAAQAAGNHRSAGWNIRTHSPSPGFVAKRWPN